MTWQECLRRYDRAHTFFFMGPPYWEAEGYGAEFGWDQYEALATTLASPRGQAIMTLNDHPAIREVFRDYAIESTDIRYTVGGGAGVERREVIIFSWNVRSEPPTLF